MTARDRPLDGESLVRIARFANAAEAGYFAHELTSHSEIPSEILVEEDFDAISGHWSTWYVLSVPEVRGAEARSTLHVLVAAGDDDEVSQFAEPAEESVSERWPGTGRRPTSFEELELDHDGINWVPIVLTLTAGSVAFWVAQQLSEQPAPNGRGVPAGRKMDELLDFLGDGTRPWVQRLDDSGVREFRFDRNRQRIELREDREGDGVFETELSFQR